MWFLTTDGKLGKFDSGGNIKLVDNSYHSEISAAASSDGSVSKRHQFPGRTQRPRPVDLLGHQHLVTASSVCRSDSANPAGWRSHFFRVTQDHKKEGFTFKKVEFNAICRLAESLGESPSFPFLVQK
ncbi:MAG: hypothetical protein JO112_04880 [Planctomycetes bacterium]|nr:hypothetical protein [Planctomycetota bacterium]